MGWTIKSNHIGKPWFSWHFHNGLEIECFLRYYFVVIFIYNCMDCWLLLYVRSLIVDILVETIYLSQKVYLMISSQMKMKFLKIFRYLKCKHGIPFNGFHFSVHIYILSFLEVFLLFSWANCIVSIVWFVSNSFGLSLLIWLLAACILGFTVEEYNADGD